MTQTSDDRQVALWKINALTEMVKAPEEFATLNVGVTSVPAVPTVTHSVPIAPAPHFPTNSSPASPHLLFFAAGGAL